MSCERKTNARVNHVPERALRIVHKNNILCFDEILKIDKSHKKHHKNIQTLAIELYKLMNNLWNQIMQKIFDKMSSKSCSSLVNRTYFSLLLLKCFSSNNLNIIFHEIKSSLNLDKFEIKIRNEHPVSFVIISSVEVAFNIS